MVDSREKRRADFGEQRVFIYSRPQRVRRLDFEVKKAARANSEGGQLRLAPLHLARQCHIPRSPPWPWSSSQPPVVHEMWGNYKALSVTCGYALAEHCSRGPSFGGTACLERVRWGPATARAPARFGPAANSQGSWMGNAERSLARRMFVSCRQCGPTRFDIH